MSKREMQITNSNIVLEETVFIFKMSNMYTMEEVKKKTLDMRRFTPNEVNQNCSKTCFMSILNNFGDLHV